MECLGVGCHNFVRSGFCEECRIKYDIIDMIKIADEAGYFSWKTETKKELEVEK